MKMMSNITKLCLWSGSVFLGLNLAMIRQLLSVGTWEQQQFYIGLMIIIPVLMIVAALVNYYIDRKESKQFITSGDKSSCLK